MGQNFTVLKGHCLAPHCVMMCFAWNNYLSARVRDFESECHSEVGRDKRFFSLTEAAEGVYCGVHIVLMFFVHFEEEGSTGLKCLGRQIALTRGALVMEPDMSRFH